MRDRGKVEADIRLIAEELGLDLEALLKEVLEKDPVSERHT